MASSSLNRRNSIDVPPAIADVFRLRNEFIQLCERDHPQLELCIKKLCEIIKKFEADFKDSTEGSRKAGVAGIIGGSALLAGAGLILVPFTFGASAVITGVGVAGTGFATLTSAGIKSRICSSEKKQQMKTLREGIESELKEFEDKINPLAEKMKDIHECSEKILRDFKKLEQSANFYHIMPEDLAGVNRHMIESMLVLTAIGSIFGGFSLVLDMISVGENSKAVGDMEKLKEKPIYEEIDESQIRSKAGKFIVDIRNLISQLKNIVTELEKTKRILSDTLRSNLTKQNTMNN